MSAYRTDIGPDRLRIDMAPSVENLDRACGDVRNFLEHCGEHESIFNVILLTREALGNAIIHGSGLSPDRPVCYELDLRDGSAYLTVTDAGNGWDWRSHGFELPPRGQEEGRGLFIIRSYSDDVTFNDKGNRITICKRLAGKED